MELQIACFFFDSPPVTVRTGLMPCAFSAAFSHAVLTSWILSPASGFERRDDHVFQMMGRCCPRVVLEKAAATVSPEMGSAERFEDSFEHRLVARITVRSECCGPREPARIGHPDPRYRVRQMEEEP